MSQTKPFSPVMPFPSPSESTSQPTGATMTQAPRKSAATPNKVLGAKIVLQYLGEDGKTYEAVHTVDPATCEVQSYSMNIECKHEKKKDPETGDLIGFEDTGERIFLLKLRYHVR
jgi:hypothetical protein